MDKRLLDYDAETHTTQWHYYDRETDETTIQTIQDMKPYLKLAAELRKDKSYSQKGIKESWWHYALIPGEIFTEIFNKYGLHMRNKEDHKAIFKVIDTEYPYFKTTTKKHA